MPDLQKYDFVPESKETKKKLVVLSEKNLESFNQRIAEKSGRPEKRAESCQANSERSSNAGNGEETPKTAKKDEEQLKVKDSFPQK